MNIPKLQPSVRKREFDSYSDDLRAQVVREWLFTNKTHRQLDEEVLGLDKELSRGYQSMGILHYLGLKAEFHSLFNGRSNAEAIDALNRDQQNLSAVVAFLEHNNAAVNIRQFLAEETKAVARSKKDSSENRKKRMKVAEKRPTRQRVYSYTYNRNPDVVAEALCRADGTCEACGDPAPFKRISDGTPFLEVHHIKGLAEGGEDTLENTLALCPNCHRKAHYGA